MWNFGLVLTEQTFENQFPWKDHSDNKLSFARQYAHFVLNEN